ncbi:MAG: trehalose-phosphatase [Desulfobacterales bacterium]
MMVDEKADRSRRNIKHWVQAVIFDLDGVVTDTAEVHARAWKQMFDEYLETLGQREGRPYRRFDREEDYLRYVDGKPRYDGVRSFLESRGIEIDTGSPDDPPRRETICGLGNRKNEIYQEFIDKGLVKVFPAAVRLIRHLKLKRIKTAVVSSSKNCQKVLAAADIEDLFDVRVDGEVSAELGLAGKPAPDIFLKAAEELSVSPEQAIVVEDAIAGVEAGRRGGFGCVIGVEPTGRGQNLEGHGADRVVGDLSEIDVDTVPQRRRTSKLPSALNRIGEIIRWREGKKTVLFLDYDGTLTPIVERPEQADLAPEMRAILKILAERCTVAIVSGRGLKDVQKRVALEGLYYAGSHGFEIDGPGQERIRNEKGSEALPALNEAENELRSLLNDIQGALVERKKYSVAVHYRRVASGQVEMVENKVDDVLQRHSGLRKGHGKKVFELQPDVEWDKGRAVLWLMERLGLQGEAVRPIYIGDDVTDEDAFRDLQERGAGIVVHGGEKRSSYARYGLVDPEEVLTFLQNLSAAISGGE